MKKYVAGILCAVTVALPNLALAFPFGGVAGLVLPCYFNSTIYVALGPPLGGSLIWTVATKTLPNGPPTHSGQYAIGLASPPYYCIFSIAPIITYSGIAMTMVGTSK